MSFCLDDDNPNRNTRGICRRPCADQTGGCPLRSSRGWWTGHEVDGVDLRGRHGDAGRLWIYPGIGPLRPDTEANDEGFPKTVKHPCASVVLDRMSRIQPGKVLPKEASSRKNLAYPPRIVGRGARRWTRSWR